MNILNGEITAITTEQSISLVKVLAEGRLFHSLVLDNPAASPWLRTGAPIRLLFKETEVMIALPPVPGSSLDISVRNQLPCRISSITRGAILCELTLALIPPSIPSGSTLPPSAANPPSVTNPVILPSFATSPINPSSAVIRSIITRSACEALDLKEDLDIIALIKTNEVSLAHD